ncbi:MAG: hypothetical protein WC099_03640 [Candidatus Paceibacterota bacterium]
MDITTNNNKWSLIITLQIICIVVILFGMVVLYDSIYQLREGRTQIVTTIPGEGFVFPSTVATTSTIVTTQNNVVTETTAYTFDQMGTFVSNAGANTNAWYLFYNTPQQMGKVVQLVFSNKSICLDVDQKVISCALGTAFVSGNQIRVIGYETGNSVTVGTLIKLTK